ncbi:MAG: type VI secretion system tip protein VgrG [Comamonadaceae bacterium]|nr:MAG: type VI secretion system tip protein VgrG [Comamonadaceae bacterium]
MAHTLSVESPAIPLFLGAPALEAVRLSGREGVNNLFEYELLLKTPDALDLRGSGGADYDLQSFIGRAICCSIELDGLDGFDGVRAGTRQINALITAAQFSGEEGRHLQYRLTLRPWLHLATLTTDCKVFQNKSVVQILDELLADYACPVDKRLIGLDGFDGSSGSYPVRDYQTQFNETDFGFFERLCQEWGINYFFEHPDGQHRLVLTDHMGGFRAAPGEAYRAIEYHPPGWKLDAEYIHSFAPQHQLSSGQYTTRDYDYCRPRADLTISRRDPLLTETTTAVSGEVYQWHDPSSGSHFAQPKAGSHQQANDPQQEGRAIALLRLQALQTRSNRASASGNLRAMVAGSFFELTNHPRQKANSEYLILDTQFLIEDVGQASQVKGAAPGRSQQWRVAVDFTAHAMKDELRPDFTRAKPVSHGPQTALVVGPEHENLWTDELGRIKVQFPWDRLGEKNQHSSCWVRVSAPWAGNQLGAMYIPRIGQEVIVDFIGGDMDLPICTGRGYNQNNRPPWALPGQAALSGFRSRELTPQGGNSAAGRSNHLVLDDTASQIQVQLKSDHQSSSLSLGHITRIEDNAGRKDARGEGFELRTDGHGVLRAGNGLLVSTEARHGAVSHAKSMDETVGRLKAARGQHQQLSDAAQQSKAHDAGDQDAVTDVLNAQNTALKGGGGGGGASPEFTQPHLTLSSPAGIQATTAGSTHIASGEHTALTSGGHTSVSAGKSLLASVKDAIHLFALKGCIRLVAGQNDIDIRALRQNIRLLAKLDISLQANRITLNASQDIEINGGGSFTRWSAGGIEHGTNGGWVEHAATHGHEGPKSLPLPDTNLSRGAPHSPADRGAPYPVSL